MGLITRERIAIIVLGLCASAAIAGTTSYTYDEQGRVTSASYSDGTLACYEYDPADNRVVYTVASGGACFAVSDKSSFEAFPAATSTGADHPL